MDIFLEKRLSPLEPRAKDWRTPYERDFGRILHSSSFRRLQGKSQVMGINESDFHRTRLTHSLEVAQIGLSLAKAIENGKISNAGGDITYYNCLKSSALLDDLTMVVMTACHAHDLGHPPFGHCGERALHLKMSEESTSPPIEKTFESNAQTLRMLTELETYEKGFGVNPTFRTILSIIKYPVTTAWYENSQETTKNPKKLFTKRTLSN